jgi:hypothetical protein
MVLDLFGVEVDPTVFFGLVLPIILFLFLRLQKNRGSHEVCELHSYQKAFLDSLGTTHGGAGGALAMIVKRAMAEPKVKAAIFDNFHCVHCGSVNPEAWIKTQKGDKTPYKLKIGYEARTFLKQPVSMGRAAVTSPRRLVAVSTGRSRIMGRSRTARPGRNK